MKTATPLVPRQALVALVVALVALGGLLAFARPAAAATSTYLRLAHLSPDTPQVDVYLSPFGRTSQQKLVLDHVGYGAMSPYQTLQTGYYTVAMRPTGADPSTPAVISTDIRLSTSKAYTLAGTGLNKQLSLRLFEDDLTPPAADESRVRVIQAANSAPSINVKTAAGGMLASDTKFATTTGYAAVPAGETSLEIEPIGGTAKASSVPVNLRGGTVLSVLVVNGANGGLTVRTVLDAEGMTRMPVGAVDTGAGFGAWASAAYWLGAGALVLVLAFLLLRRRRSPQAV